MALTLTLPVDALTVFYLYGLIGATVEFLICGVECPHPVIETSYLLLYFMLP